jgi:hypothetical protein
MDNIFRKGDRVYHYEHGWGHVIETCDMYDFILVNVNFANNPLHIKNTFKNGYMLSFTEYTLEGFTQERPEPLPNKGDIVWVRDDDSEDWRITHFFHKDIYGNYLASIYYNDLTPPIWKYMTTKNPYTNEQ